MALLITGATGHVGLTIVRLAVEAGVNVVAQHRSPVPQSVVEQFGDRVRWAHCSLDDAFSLATALAEYDIEGCIHTAAVPNDRVAHAIPWETVQTNAMATAALLELARRLKWRRFIYVSTGSVFQKDMDLDQPLLEDHPLSPSSLYGSTKAAGEFFVGMYRKQYGLSASTVRISFVYGPPLVPAVRDLPRGPIVAYLREAILGIPIRETGGDFVASFTHVDDVAAGLLTAYQAPKLNHDVYHLGPGRNWTTYEVAEAVRAAVPGAIVEVGPGTRPWTTYNRMRGPLAGTRLEEDTGFTPSLPLAKGVSAFAAWMKNNMDRLQR
jgi:nucleoside-diphosphate-sugar epimerase